MPCNVYSVWCTVYTPLSGPHTRHGYLTCVSPFVANVNDMTPEADHRRRSHLDGPINTSIGDAIHRPQTNPKNKKNIIWRRASSYSYFWNAKWRRENHTSAGKTIKK